MAIAEDRDVNKRQVWDCGSSLYDSFELNSFMLRLDSAISSSRCLSMPHSSSSSSFSSAAAAASMAQPQSSRRKRSRLAKSVQKLVQSVLRLNRSVFGAPRVRSHDQQHAGLYCDGEVLRSGRLEAIPEVCEKELAAAASASPGIDYDADATVRKAASERFAAGATAGAMS
ncbi:uncharacterized protein LOC122011819 [Zingiber officinale]|uniref:Uncharacterized protein n=1 Tax=Zingiber officinale TaxID=94328 RepID=A0A8J5FK50_ZINOF|nr:uncharacterized protein LOC122011819 [Zingiber officinale]KAG6485707.1 hypothetical protein ZIOFF_054272 [Zingiber officinale]